ncbi:MAG: flagellar basal body rod modification protein [Comamonas sp.]|nr:flagellar basal body rod modification protein [Comamonas sp.]
MSLINSATTASGTAGSSSDAISQALGGSELGQMFTKLLVAQVKYQDPLQPTDSSTFVTQLTQLSQTESLQSLSSQLSAQSSILDSLQTMQLGSQVGSTVMVSSSSLQLADAPLQAVVNLPASAELTLQLTAPDGKVTTVPLGARGVGDASFAVDPVALGLPAGRYDIAVKDAGGTSYPVEVAGKLQAVRMTSTGAVALQVQGLGDVLPSRITRFVGQQA